MWYVVSSDQWAVVTAGRVMSRNCDSIALASLSVCRPGDTLFDSVWFFGSFSICTVAAAILFASCPCRPVS
ncbi:putative HTH-type transcriptional regulator YjiR [Trichinella spiralis]|uniref:HTH-type transcriptional regulator YjiR n=1 Tax=Trichinella spiralis TaxID=6334 RepID=A0ABR3KYL2_TRISP